MRRANAAAETRPRLGVAGRRSDREGVPSGVRDSGRPGLSPPPASRLGISVLAVSVARSSLRDLADRITSGGVRVDVPDTLHAGTLDQSSLAGTANCIALDGRGARASAVYRAVVRLRALGWSRGIVLFIDPDAIGIVPVASSVGATDFVLSTATTDELVTRLNRAGSMRAEPSATSGAEVRPGIELHWRTHHVSCGGTRIPVTLRQMQLLDALMARPGEIITARDLARLAWGHSKGRSSSLAATFVCSLRKKLAWFGGSFGIQTVRGLGYRFVQHSIAAQVSRT